MCPSVKVINKHPRVKRVVFQMRAKPFVPRRHVKRVSTTCQLRKLVTSRATVFTQIKKLLFALWIRPSGLTNPIPSYSHIRDSLLCFLCCWPTTLFSWQGVSLFFFIAIGSIEPRDYRVVFFIQERSSLESERTFPLQKSLAEFRRQSGGKVEIIFRQGVYLTKNTSHPASVRAQRVHAAGCSLLKKVPQHFFESS